MLVTQYDEARLVAGRIDRLIATNESFFVWGDMPSLYLYTKREAPTPYFWSQGYFDGPLTNKIAARVIADLEDKKPPLAVVCAWRAHAEINHPVFGYLCAHYTPLPPENPPGLFQMVVRTNGRLFQRILNSRSLARVPFDRASVPDNSSGVSQAQGQGRSP